MKPNDPLGGRRGGILCLFVLCLIAAVSTSAQETRKLIERRAPVYPDVARRTRLNGTVKVQIVIGTDGQVKDVKVIGGHPLFVDATLEALKNWKYAPSNSETITVLEFNFNLNDGRALTK